MRYFSRRLLISFTFLPCSHSFNQWQVMNIRSARKVLIISFTWWSETVCKEWSRSGSVAADSKEIQWHYRHGVWTRKMREGNLLKRKTWKINIDRVRNSTKIKELEQEEVYKYRGVNESNAIQHVTMKEKIRKECYRRIGAIFKAELNSRNWVQAINTLAIRVVTYSFNIINWNLSEIKKMDTKICTLLRCNRMIIRKRM